MRIYKDASEISLVIARQKLPKTRRHYCVHKSEPAMERVCGVTHELLHDVIFASLHRNSCAFREPIERENSSVSRCLPRRILLLVHLEAKQRKVLTGISLNFPG